ncbi:MAG: gfo/Idh/MocA family oxidoreductase, partial [Frankiales bacterium]|nr:gfo/Idh/MocA family oxidoreductase [Frankiales bacterium]
DAVPPTELYASGSAPDGFLLGHVRQYADLVDAIRRGREPGVTARDGLNALAAVRAMYVSATLRRPVAFADVVAGAYDDLTIETRGTAARP